MGLFQKKDRTPLHLLRPWARPERGSGDLRPEGGHVCRFQLPILQVRPIERVPPRPAKADFSG